MRCCWPSHLRWSAERTGTRLRRESRRGHVSVGRGAVAASTDRAADREVENPAGSLSREGRTPLGSSGYRPWVEPASWRIVNVLAAMVADATVPGAPVPGALVPGAAGARGRAPGLRFLLRCPGCPASVGVLTNEIHGLPGGVGPRSRRLRSRWFGRIRATTPRTATVTGPVEPRHPQLRDPGVAAGDWGTVSGAWRSGRGVTSSSAGAEVPDRIGHR
jgi:hypothetical protein